MLPCCVREPQHTRHQKQMETLTNPMFVIFCDKDILHLNVESSYIFRKKGKGLPNQSVYYKGAFGTTPATLGLLTIKPIHDKVMKKNKTCKEKKTLLARVKQMPSVIILLFKTVFQFFGGNHTILGNSKIKCQMKQSINLAMFVG